MLVVLVRRFGFHVGPLEAYQPDLVVVHDLCLSAWPQSWGRFGLYLFVGVIHSSW
jgi:hypothetical protein